MEKFNPADATNALKEGVVNFQITAAENKVSAAGKPMIKLTIKAKDTNGKSAYLTYFIMQPYQIKQIFKCCNMDMTVFESGHVLCSFYIDNKGKAEVVTEYSERYGDKSVIKKFLVHPSLIKDILPKEEAKSEDPFNDDVPF